MTRSQVMLTPVVQDPAGKRKLHREDTCVKTEAPTVRTVTRSSAENGNP